jgi:penicillin-binding protein 2
MQKGTTHMNPLNLTPKTLEKIIMDKETLNAVRTGMKNVADEGSARAIFSDYPMKIGGKTGTAQLGNNLANNAIFTAFAPYDNPEIAISVVIEHGVRGANAAYVARDLFDEYFNINNSEEE